MRPNDRLRSIEYLKFSMKIGIVGKLNHDSQRLPNCQRSAVQKSINTNDYAQTAGTVDEDGNKKLDSLGTPEMISTV